MLKQLILENWKSFRYAELPLDPLTVLIGTNASGKSNVVEALEFLQRIAKGENIEAALAGDKTFSSIRGGVEWAAYKPETQFTLKAVAHLKNTTNDDLIYKIKVQTKPEIKITKESIELLDNTNEDHQEPLISSQEYRTQSRLIETIFESDNIEKKITEIRQAIKKYEFSIQELNFGKKELENILQKFNDNDIVKNKIDEQMKRIGESIQVLNNRVNSLIHVTEDITIESNFLKDQLDKIDELTFTLKNIFTLHPIPSKMRDYSPFSETLESDASNIAGVLAALPEKQKTEVESNLSEYIKNLPEGDIKKVFAESVGRLKHDAMLYCEEEWKPGETTLIDAKTMSDGTLRFLAILTALLTRPEGSQIVIEEIDNGLHPSRAKLLVKILREIGAKRNIDILLTTHNPALLDALGPEIVPFVVVAHRDSETGESKLTLLEDIDNFPKLFASYSLGDMTTKGAIERSLSHGE